MKVIGYLVQTERGLEGEPGLFYDYILARNGLFVRAQSHLIEAVVNIAPAEVRGLQCLREMVRLSKGRIPKSIYDLAISTLLADRYRERYLAVTWEGEYHLKMPPQESSSGGVEYEVLPNTVVDIHSHAAMSAFFSSTDDSDEQGLRLYMVVGRLDTLLPEVELRLGVYGYFVPMNLDEVFDVYPRQ
jgi:PRTRC genetic system protein A